MADNIEIQIGDQIFRVPRWATEETAREMSKYNQASARALTEIAKQTAGGRKVAQDNQKIFRELKAATKRDYSESVKSEEKLNKIRSEHGNALKNTTNTLKSTSKDLLDAFNKDSLAGVAAALGSIVGLGAVAGFAVGVLEKFSSSIADLSNVGIGLGSSLIELRNQATLTGLNIEDYGKLVMGNGDAIRALGESAQDGARNFSLVSRSARIAARDFNNFGMSNTEYNEALLEEIQIRRRSGLEQDQITSNLAESMNQLLAETTGLSAITGQDRREMMRRRQEMAMDPAIAAFRMTLGDAGSQVARNFDSLATVFGAGGEVGSQLGLAFGQSFATGIDFRSINENLATMTALSPSAGVIMDEIFRFVNANMASMDTREFNAQLVTMLAELGESVPTEELQNLSIFAARGVDGASELISLIGELQGLNTDIQENREGMSDAIQGLAGSDLLALSSTIQETTNRIKDSALTSVLDALGVDVDASGGELVDAIRRVADSFGPDNTLFDGFKNLYMENKTSLELFKDAVIAAAIALGSLSMFSGGRRFIRGAAGLGNRTIRRGASGTRGSLSRMLPALTTASRFAGPATAITAGLTPTALGDGTITSQFDRENPFPENGNQAEIEDWHRRREEYASSIPMQTQAEIDAEYNRIMSEKQRVNAFNNSFENMSPIEQADARMETPGTRGYLDNMRSNGLDAETHAILTGRTFERMEEYMRRQMEETTRLRRAIEDNQ